MLSPEEELIPQRVSQRANQRNRICVVWRAPFCDSFPEQMARAHRSSACPPVASVIPSCSMSRLARAPSAGRDLVDADAESGSAGTMPACWTMRPML